MTISVNQLGKRYNRNWIFKNITTTFEPGAHYAILGLNGSGKSTFCRILCGMQAASEGTIEYFNHLSQRIDSEKIFEQFSICAPAFEILEEFTLLEFLNYHFSFKKKIDQFNSSKEMIQLLGLEHATNLPIKQFSSGMKQRVKLAQAIFVDAPILLLDEPCSNLDEKGFEQFYSWINTYKNERTIIIASNDDREYNFLNPSILKINEFSAPV
jgi:ABC-type multidrug transport system ATPase subunit